MIEPPPPPNLFEWTPAAPPPRPAGVADSLTVKLRPSRHPVCLECGGLTDDDGYCQSCGARVPTPREHFEAAPVAWVGGVCDRGRQHHRNEDALALWAAAEPELRAVLVVCDGVSSSQDSDVAALAGAEAARDLLAQRQPDGVGVPASRDAAMADVLVEAAAAANTAVIAHTAATSQNAASATFAAAVVRDDEIHYANLGDSRVYWLGAATRVQLSVDHSAAEELIRAGSTRAEAEASPQAHAITRWLGRDAEDIVPATGVHRITEDGWLLVCSDGLWNYASGAADLGAQLDAALVEGPEPVAVARRLVAWANAQGGRDNITVALAHVPATLHESPATTAER